MSDFKKIMKITDIIYANLDKLEASDNVEDVMNVFIEVYNKGYEDAKNEHPIKTNADKFKEVFGVELDFEEIADCTNKCILICGETDLCKDCAKNDFWNREYKEPKEV